jgi:hypothetical protein
MQESDLPAAAEEVAAYVGIDWADRKHDVILRPATEPAKVEHSRITQQPEALMDWLGELQRRFAGKGKILVALEQSRGGLIYHLMSYEFLELYPINPSQLLLIRLFQQHAIACGQPLSREGKDRRRRGSAYTANPCARLRGRAGFETRP